MSFFRHVATVGGLTLISRIAGFTRDLLTAAFLGAGPLADAFFVALKLPNFLRRFFAEGAFSAAFVPQFSRRLQEKGLRHALLLADQALSVMLAFLLPLCLAAIAFMPQVVSVIAPGFIDDPDRFIPAVDMARITFPYILFISLVALQGGVLNALDRFSPFAAAPILFNASLITAMLFFTEMAGGVSFALAYGVAAAGMAQLLWMSWFCVKSRTGLKLRWPRFSPEIKKLLKIMGPAALGAGVVQVNLLIDILLASLLPAGAVSYLYYADRLNQLPLGVIGVAIGTALLPTLSRALKADNQDEAGCLFNRSLEVGLLFALPSAVALAFLADDIIAVLFQRGEFVMADTKATALALSAYAIGLPATIAAKSLTTSFFAQEDTTTPLKISFLTTIVNLVLNLLLIGPMQHAGRALATALAACVQAIALFVMLHRKSFLRIDRRVTSSFCKMVLAVLIMLAGLSVLKFWIYPLFLLRLPDFLPDFLAVYIPLSMIALGVYILCGVGLYFGVIFLTGVLKFSQITALLRKPS